VDKLNLAIIIATLPMVIVVKGVGWFAGLMDTLEARLGQKKQTACIPLRADLPARRRGR
jgi:hypothetical protein